MEWQKPLEETAAWEEPALEQLSDLLERDARRYDRPLGEEEA